MESWDMCTCHESENKRCVQLEPWLQMAVNKITREQSGAELETDMSSQTLSAPGSDAYAVFACSITD